jgi:hypothetical protein
LGYPGYCFRYLRIFCLVGETGLQCFGALRHAIISVLS